MSDRPTVSMMLKGAASQSTGPTALSTSGRTLLPTMLWVAPSPTFSLADATPRFGTSSPRASIPSPPRGNACGRWTTRWRSHVVAYSRHRRPIRRRRLRRRRRHQCHQTRHPRHHHQQRHHRHHHPWGRRNLLLRAIRASGRGTRTSTSRRRRTTRAPSSSARTSTFRIAARLPRRIMVMVELCGTWATFGA